MFEEINRLILQGGEDRAGQQVDEKKSGFNEQYIFARLEGNVIRNLVHQDGKGKADIPDKDGKPRTVRAIYQIWDDFPLKALITSSVSTVKADAAKVAFSALGKNIVWAVIDSGIQGDHPHFGAHRTLRGQVDEWHYDFTGGADPSKTALVDGFGHGTHVAGIIAGEIPPLSDLLWAGRTPISAPIPARSNRTATRPSAKWSTIRSRPPPFPAWRLVASS